MDLTMVSGSWVWLELLNLILYLLSTILLEYFYTKQIELFKAGSELNLIAKKND